MRPGAVLGAPGGYLGINLVSGPPKAKIDEKNHGGPPALGANLLGIHLPGPVGCLAGRPDQH